MKTRDPRSGFRFRWNLERAGLFLAAILTLVGQPVLPAEPVAIYADSGTDGESILALARTLFLGGYTPLTIADEDLDLGRLDRGEFRLLVLPNAQRGDPAEYAAHFSAGSGRGEAVRRFVEQGGGLLVLGAGARLVAARENWNGLSGSGALALWDGEVIGPPTALGWGLGAIILEPAWPKARRCGERRGAMVQPGAPAFVDGGSGEVLARYWTGRAGDREEGQGAIVRFSRGAGRVTMVGPALALDVRSWGDWTFWDDILGQSADGEHDQGLLLSLVDQLRDGFDRTPAALVFPEPAGQPMALYSTRTVEGGAYPAILTAVARGAEQAGFLPLAVREMEIKNAWLNPDRFDLVFFPGGWAPGYQAQLDGYESWIRAFVRAGGGYLGICAGAFFPADWVVWEGTAYDYPLDLFKGTVTGPVGGLEPWPIHQLTPIRLDDPVLGQGRFHVWYQGGGQHQIPTPNEQGVVVGGTYDHLGSGNGKVAVARHTLGLGRALYSNVHVEVEEGADRDWMALGDRDADGPVFDPESEWDLFSRMLHWVAPQPRATLPARPSLALPLLFGAEDDTAELLGEIHGDDAYGPPPTEPIAWDGRISLSPGHRLHLRGFGGKPRRPFGQARLVFEYSAAADFKGTAAVEWRLGTEGWGSTGLVPAAGARDIVLEFDLHQAGVLTPDQLDQLEVRYIHTGAAGGGISFDRLGVSLPADRDGDGVGDFDDCSPTDPGAFAVPVEPVLSWSGDRTLQWAHQGLDSGEGSSFDLAWGRLADLAVDQGPDRAACRNLLAPEDQVPDHPAPGEGWYFIVRARNGCGTSAWGSEKSPGCKR